MVKQDNWRAARNAPAEPNGYSGQWTVGDAPATVVVLVPVLLLIVVVQRCSSALAGGDGAHF